MPLFPFSFRSGMPGACLACSPTHAVHNHHHRQEPTLPHPPPPTPHLPSPTPAHLPADYLSDKAWVASFEKPKGNPAALLRPATTVLSPYLKFGCLSPRLFHARLLQASSRNCRGS